MKRSLLLALAATLLAASLALAEPTVEVSYHAGVPQVALSGNYAQSRYTIYRASSQGSPFVAITANDVLCIGRCYVQDFDAVPGRTYWYRFDITPSSGAPVSFGPYPVTIAAPLPGSVNARIYPNPSSDVTRIDLYQLGAASEGSLQAEAMVLDLQGRRVRMLTRGPLGRGITTVTWDGRDERGRALGAGTYFLRFSSPLGSTIHRIVRVR